MSLFYNILEEQKDLLERKGYDELSLNSPYKNGWFMREVEIGFSLASNEASRLNEIVDFDVKAIGFFNNDRDIVVFKFHYECDPNNLTLNIKSLSAELNGKSKEYDLIANEDLPIAKTVYEELKQGARLQIARLIANHTAGNMKRKL